LILPVVYRRAVQVSPLATIVAVLIGGTLLGLLGALLAIPAADKRSDATPSTTGLGRARTSSSSRMPQDLAWRRCRRQIGQMV
jgi:hypothetical protein